MYPVSPAFTAALPYSHTVATRVDVLTAGQVSYRGLQVLAGNVTVDRANAVRRTVSLQLVGDATMTPASARDLLAPYGNELAVYRGLVLPAGPELVPLGVFRISSVDVGNHADLTIAVGGSDRSRTVARAGLTDYLTVSAGTDLNAATATLISAALPGLVFNLAGTASVTPQLVYAPGDDMWKAASELQAADGKDLYFDVLGQVRSTPVPNPLTAATVASYVAGSTAMLLPGLHRRQADDPGYNNVVVSAQSTSTVPPVVGSAGDTNPASATYVGGPYGRVTKYVQSDLPTSGAQASAMAAGLLQAALGLTEQVTMPALVNPAHDVNDVVQITEPATKTSALYVLDSVQVPLAFDGALTASTRRTVTT